MSSSATADATRPRRVAVIGAGPVGCLAALSMAKLGCRVDIYEGRPDMRLPSSRARLQRRSVNLAISARGLAALEFVDPAMASRFLQTVIPMRGRVIHDEAGNSEVQPYDVNGLSINSIDRALLNEGLLDEVSARNDITINFQHKLTTADFDTRKLSFDRIVAGEKSAVQVDFDLCIGADGSYSNVRRQLMRVVPMDYQQQYIPHEYIELRIPPGHGSSVTSPNFVLDPNGLHIWPRHSFMLIALPNKDGSFTSTVFAPQAEFARLRERKDILSWFRAYFSDALDLMGEDELVYDFMNNPRNSLISIKANPYHYGDRAVILGDAAHSMVPFYGQGLNCGLEDVRVLSSLMISRGISSIVPANAGPDWIDEGLSSALGEYTRTRHEDLVAICDLAMQNYVEMRHGVTTWSYRIRKTLDGWLSKVLPSPPSPLLSFGEVSSTPVPRQRPRGWLSLYTMVTFRPDIPYALAKEKDEFQNKVLTRAGWILVGVGSLGLVASLISRSQRCV